MKSDTKSSETMTCGACEIECQRFGKHRNDLRRFRCPRCHKTYTEAHARTLGSMYVPQAKAAFALQLLIEGNSIRSTMRLTGLDQNTIMKALVLAGEKCEKLMGRKLVNIPVKDVQVDEIWGYVGKKEAHKLPMESDDDSIGDAYCFVAIERGTKLVLNFALGRRSQATTDAFIEGLRAATSPQHFQLTADGFQPYVSAITTTLSDRCDFAQLIKVYAEAPKEDRRRYSPADVTHAEKVPVMGNPDPAKICTSHVERQNLTIRMSMRRLTRLTNAFSKKWENLWAAYCVHFAYYNFCRIHKTLRVTPAMEAKITDHVWELGELMA
ncbi:MAG: IS1 family transposase [Bryobacteraceae bacterium]|jgi:transposase-like protein/IS1 family transposase